MKIEKFNESLKKDKSYYKLYVYVGDDPTEMHTHNTVKNAIDELQKCVSNGLPGTDGNTYYIHDAYIEKISMVKTDEIAAIINAKKYNL